MVDCVLLIFSIILASGNIRKRTNFPYLKHLKFKILIRVSEAKNGTYGIRWQMFELQFFFKFNCPGTYENERISQILSIWNRTCRSCSRRRKTRLTALNIRLCIADFFIIVIMRQHTITNEFHIFETFEIENVDQGREGEQRDLRCSIANVRMCIVDYFS